MPEEVREFFTLPSGKRLAYTDFGPPSAAPVLLLHGAPGSATYFSRFPEYPYGTRWRMIGVDRPGFGQSDMWRCGYAEFARALDLLREHLDLRQVDVLGVSAGGPCALACGAVFPSAIGRVMAVSSMAPMNPQLLAGISRTNQVVYWLARNLPGISRLNSHLVARFSRDNMERFIDKSKGKFSAADRAELQNPSVRQVLIEAAKDAYQSGSGQGLAQDLENQATSWDFELGAVNAATHIWAPVQDTSTPLPMARDLHVGIPGSRLHVVPDGGHLWHIRHLQQVLEQSEPDSPQP